MTTHETLEAKHKTFDSPNIDDVNDGGLRLRHGSGKSTKKNPLVNSDEIDRAKHVSDLKVKTTTSGHRPTSSGHDSDADISINDTKPKRSNDAPIFDYNTYWLTRIVMLRSVAFLCCKRISFRNALPTL